MNIVRNFPRQKLAFSAKNKTWRRQVVDWADNKSFLYDQATRKSYYNKKINLNLYNGKVDINDMKLILNPLDLESNYIPGNIQHYPVVSPKIDLLVGEESKRRFDFQVIITNPNAISGIEKQKKELVNQKLTELVTSYQIPQEKVQEELENIAYFANYEWQDEREKSANYLLMHYIKELDFKLKVNKGFKNALIVGEEAYKVDIVQDDLSLDVLNPRKLHVLRNGYSDRIEDADVIIYDDMWNPGRIIDTFYDQLTAKDIEKLDKYPHESSSNEMHEYDETQNFIFKDLVDTNNAVDDSIFLMNGMGATFNHYYDSYGNIRVLKVWWKSKRKIVKVKKYDIDGEPYFEYYPETYVPLEATGEETETLWINEAWEGVKIGRDIYVNMRPCKVQYNRMTNPSRCHFGIIGTIYSTNEARVVSFLDRTKPYQYLYDVVHNRLRELIETDYGQIGEIDLAKIPDGWEPDKWLYYATKLKIAFVDSFKEGNKGASMGHLAGGMNTVGGRTMNLSQANAITYHLQMLDWIDNQIGLLSGVSKQREGSISSSETVGGVERAVTQSSHITEEYYLRHDNTKKRLLECILETAKILLKGKSKKIQYITDDGSKVIFNIDGPSFAEVDYGLVIDNDTNSREMMQKMDNLAHAALQTGTLSFSTIMSVYTDPSLNSVRRRIEADEKARIAREQKAAQEQSKAQQAQLEEMARQFNEGQLWEEEKFYTEQQNKLAIAELGKEDNTLELAKIKADLEDKKIQSKERLENSKFNLEKEKLYETSRHNKEAEKISKIKPNKTK